MDAQTASQTVTEQPVSPKTVTPTTATIIVPADSTPSSPCLSPKTASPTQAPVVDIPSSPLETASLPAKEEVDIAELEPASPVASSPVMADIVVPKLRRSFDKDGHDSMVTVRLSEPPSLHVNTDVPPNALPTRRSIFGPECTPTSAVTPYVLAIPQLEVPSADVQVETEVETATDVSEEKDQDNMSILESPRGTRILESPIEEDEDSDPEEVNWDELQRTEDEQSKAKDQDDNVCIPLSTICACSVSLDWRPTPEI